MEAVFPKVLLKSWTSSVFFVLLGLGVSCTVSGMVGLDISAGSAGIRRSIDQVVSDLLKVLFCELVVRLKLLFMFIGLHCKVDEVSICAELHQGSKPL
jgi:hypothetical protein